MLLKLLNKIPNWLIWSMVAFAFIGMIDAFYLTYTHYTGTEIVCTIYAGCNEVAQSEYSKLFGIPLSLLGTFYYFTVLFLSLLYIDTKKHIFAVLIIPIATFGFLFSIYLTYLQLWVIEALCIYCLSSGVTSSLLFIFSMVMLFLCHKKPCQNCS